MYPVWGMVEESAECDPVTAALGILQCQKCSSSGTSPAVSPPLGHSPTLIQIRTPGVRTYPHDVHMIRNHGMTGRDLGTEVETVAHIRNWKWDPATSSLLVGQEEVA